MVREKGGRFVDLRRLLGDAKRRTGRKVVGVRSAERTGERSLRRDRIVVDGTEEDDLFGTKFRAYAAKIEEKRRIP